jgi:molybdopterin/thiamine biosynthesis adenylyltransferase
VVSRDIAALDLPSLERFRTDLVQAGFDPRPGDLRIWSGPISDSLRELTSEQTMQVEFVDGWPFRPPKLFVDGLDEWHLSASGEVCLWTTGAASDQWLTLEGFLRRVDEWVERAKKGFRPEDFALDAHLSFEKVRYGAIATVDLSSLRLEGKEGHGGRISGTWKKNDPVLEIRPGTSGAIEGRWYFAGDIRVPPRTLDAVRGVLAPNQRNNFDRRFKAIERHGATRVFLLTWDRELGREALVLIAERSEGHVIAEAIEVAPTDKDVLSLRAGPDSPLLADKRVVVFGVGAIGSNLALRLAEVGVGELVVVDGDRIRPGDVVRHAALSLQVGDTKLAAVRFLANLRAPWTKVIPIEASSWNPSEIEKLVEGVNLVVDATGFASFANLLSVVATDAGVPLLSVALYRGGAVGRVRRQAGSADTPITDRSGDDRYPVIPPGDEPVSYEPGCSAPVNNASPLAVAATSALAGLVAVDTLMERFHYTEETMEVFRALEDSPFDRVGRLS